MRRSVVMRQIANGSVLGMSKGGEWGKGAYLSCRRKICMGFAIFFATGIVEAVE